MDKKSSVIKSYFRGLETRSYQEIIKLFSSDAIVHSPLFGQIRADKFYKDLFSVTSSSKITLQNIFLSENNPNIASAHFLYDWTLKDGTLAPFECIDVFEFSTDDKIKVLKIIYDTWNVRERFETATSNKCR